MGSYVWPNPPYYANAISHFQVMTTMKEWIKNRALWIDENLDGQAVDCELYADPDFEITSTGEIGEEQALRVFPNPSDAQFTLQTHSPIISLSLGNGLGQVVYHKEFHNHSTMVTLDLQLPPGPYHIRVGTRDGWQRSSLLIIQ